MKAFKCTSLLWPQLPPSRAGNVASMSLKRQMERWYSEYAKTYDRDGYHTRIARRLVEGLDIKSGDKVLDLATGTGLAGFFALEAAGKSGQLIGIDISPEMLARANQTCRELELSNAQFVLGDVQDLDFEDGTFDIMICSSALILLPDIPWTLNYWRRFLKPGGALAVHCFSEGSFVRGKLIQKAASEFGIELVFSEPTGTIDKCKALMETAGYANVRIEEVVGGKYIPLDAVLDAWDRSILHPMVQLPSLVKSDADLESMKDRYRQLAEALVTDEGVWDDDTIMHVYSQRPETA